MSMYDEVKIIKECVRCRRTLSNKSITVMYENKCLCDSCYKREIANSGSDRLNSDKPSHKKELEDSFEWINNRSFFSERFRFPEKKKIPMTPREIVAYLDKNIVGQDDAKKALAVAVYNHYRRINANADDIKIPKSNVLIQGPTGCGKTYILKTLADLLEVPFFIADASLITESGYKGNDVESIITGLYQVASGDIEKTQKGIIYLDEFDKLSAKYGHTSAESSVGAGVQRQMLKMIEGCVMEIPKSGYKKSGDCVSINTENILFICGGAFVGIKREKDIKSTHAIGFCTEVKSGISKMPNEEKLCPQDFINFGLIPEMVGRLPIIVSLSNLSESDLADVLRNTEKSLIKRYCALFKEAYGVELVFQNSAITEIAHQAYVRRTGARGLNAIVENVMQDLLFDIPSEPEIRKCIITREVVQCTAKPYIIRDDDLINRHVS